MTEPRRVSLIWIILFALVAVLIVLDVSYGNGGDRHDDDDGDGDVEVITDLAGGDNTSRLLSLGQALGGVDIVGCVVTTQFGIIIYVHQGYKYDVFCLARELDQAGKYEDAAAMRCLQKIPRKLYGARCLDVMNYEPPESDNQRPEDAAQMTIFESRIQAQEKEQEASIDRFDALERRLDREAAARGAYARKAEAEKEAERQRAQKALDAYKEAQNGQ